MLISIYLAPHVPAGTPSAQPLEMQFLFARRKESFAGPQRQRFPSRHSQSALTLAIGMGAYPQGQGFATALHWSRIWFIPLFFCVAGETCQLAFIVDLRPERCPPSLGSISALPSLFKALLRL